MESGVLIVRYLLQSNGSLEPSPEESGGVRSCDFQVAFITKAGVWTETSILLRLSENFSSWDGCSRHFAMK